MLSNSSLVQNKGARWLRCSPVPKALCALIGALLLTPLVAHAQDASPVTLGILMPKQGVLGEIGRDGQRGAMMAIEDADSKVLNRPVKVVWADDPNPQAAQENFSKMVDADKVVAIVGGISSASTLASSATAKQRKIPFVSVTAATNELTGKLCNRYTFRTFTPISVSARALEGPMLEKGKKWYFIVPNYATGQDIYRDMHADLLKAGGEEVGYDNVAMDNSDFSSFILKIRQAKPDAVIVGQVGSGLVSFLKQWGQYGMAGKIPLGDPTISESLLWALPPESETGTYVKFWDYNDPANPPIERKFARDYRKKFGEPASLVAWSGWMSTRAVLAAIEAGKSTDPASIVHQLETLKWQDRKVTSYYRPWDHQFIHPVAIGIARPPKADKWDVLDIAKSIPADNSQVEAIFGSKADSSCQMDSL